MELRGWGATAHVRRSGYLQGADFLSSLPQHPATESHLTAAVGYRHMLTPSGMPVRKVKKFVVMARW